MLKDTLLRMNRALESPPFNLIIHSAPFTEAAGEFYHWHLEIMPKLTKVAGFEWGTGSTSTRRRPRKQRRSCARWMCEARRVPFPRPHA